MNRLDRLAMNLKDHEKLPFIAGFTAARKMCAAMARIAQLEGKDAQAEVLKVGTEEVEKPKLSAVPEALSDVIINTLE